MAKFKANRPLLHDGTHYETGAAVDLGDADAKALLDSGVVTAVEVATKPDGDKGKGFFKGKEDK